MEWFRNLLSLPPHTLAFLFTKQTFFLDYLSQYG